MTLTLALSLMAVLLLLSAFFSSGEISILSANRLRLRQMAEEGDPRARRILRFIDRPSEFFSLIQIGNNTVNVAMGTVATSLAYAYGGELLFVFNAVAVALIILFGEVIPKSLAAKKPEPFAIFLGPALRVAYFLLFPAIAVLSLVSSAAIRLLGGQVTDQGPFVTEEEIQILLHMGERSGAVDKQEKEMIQGVFEFGDTLVREVMVPRIDMVCLPVNAPLQRATDLILKTGHSRIPLFEDRVDRIVGILYAKDLLQHWGHDELSLREICRPAFFVPETKRVSELFTELKKRKVHIAIVLDEYGGVAGLVTVEDLLEEIVGEIQDEYDREEPDIHVVSPTETLMNARVNLNYASKLLNCDFAADGVDTLGGYIYQILGRVPEVGARVRCQDLVFIVEEVQGHRIQKVRAMRQPSGDGALRSQAAKEAPPSDAGTAPPAGRD